MNTEYKGLGKGKLCYGQQISQQEREEIENSHRKMINEIFKDWSDLHQKQNNINNIYNDKKEIKEFKKLKKMPYEEYLKSQHWINTRNKALVRAKYKCQLCGEKEKALHVHHNTYENKGNEKDEDLIVLCEDCHARYHNKISQSSKLKENKRIAEELRELGIDDADNTFLKV